MYDKKVGVAVLTSSGKWQFLQDTIESFLKNCSYRPLVIGIFDNGSDDGSWDYIQNLAKTKVEGVEWRIERSDINLGCGPGVNRANKLIGNTEFEYSMFLESDWVHLDERESGVPKTWMNEAIEFMQTGKCDYAYLRRYKNSGEAAFHDWNWVLEKAKFQEDKYLFTEKYMYSNNPHIRRTQALFNNKTLPVPEYFDEKGNPLEKKGNKEFWGKAEHASPQPPNLWFRVWGMFLHESVPTPEKIKTVGCGKYGPYGCSTCKYGFLNFKNGWCALCDASKDYHDLNQHEMRFRNYFSTMLNMRRQFMPCINDMEFNGGNNRDV